MRKAVAVAFVALVSFSSSSYALDENPDAPVGVVGLTAFFNRSDWGDLETEIRSGGLTLVEPNDDFEQDFSNYGVEVIAPVANRLTLRGTVARGAITARDAGFVDFTFFEIEETQKAWQFHVSATVWIGR